MSERTAANTQPAGRRKSRRRGTLDGVVENASEDVDVVRMAATEAHNRLVQRHAQIATAAYFRAQKRGFAAGHELDDWLAAEQDVAEQRRLDTLSPTEPRTTGSVP